MAEVVIMREYEERTVAMSSHQASALAATNAVAVSPDAVDGMWQVKATQMVGSVSVDGLAIRIRPKIALDNLLFLLEVGLPDKAWRRQFADYATVGDLLPAVVAFFARSAEGALARGCYRSYREHREPLVALRGRVDLVRQFARGGLLAPVDCQFDEFTPDVLENRYLKAAIRRAVRIERVRPIDRLVLRRQLVALDTVDDRHVRAEDLDQVSETRLNAHYMPALRLARLILDRSTLVDTAGGTRAESFLLDMNKLFEQFVTERLRLLLTGQLTVAAQTMRHLGEGGRVPMRPDLEFHRMGEPVYVADLKYKVLKGDAAYSSDFFQLLAYATALNLPEGLLIYCDTDGETPTNVVTVRHAGKVLRTYPISLAGPPEQVAEQVEDLADRIMTWVRPLTRAIPGSSLAATACR
jgi:5-methylcytosine-specific restriction enzyme subunit McrC